MIKMARPSSNALLSTLASNKWTCTQYNAGVAYYWGAAASYGNKNGSCVVLPFFAY